MLSGGSCAPRSARRSRWSRTAASARPSWCGASTPAPAGRAWSASPGRPAPASRRWSTASPRRCAGAGRRSASSASIRPRPSRAARFSATGSACRVIATDPGVFIRSMATRGALGGLARATRDAVDLLDAAGFDWVLVETVGVGQDEIDIVRTVDTVLVVAVPGLGDDIQAIKAGIMEIADVFVLNKADREGADRTFARPRDDALARRRDDRRVLAAADPPDRRGARGGGRGAARRDREAPRLDARPGGARRPPPRAVEASGRDASSRTASSPPPARRRASRRRWRRGFARHLDPYRLADALFEGVVRAEAARVGAREEER